MSRLAVATAVAILLSAVVARAEDRAVHDGTVKSVELTKLTILDKAGKETSFNVPASVPITIHGKAGKLEELKPGTIVRVTTGLKGEVAAVTTIEPLMIVSAGK